ncbi:endonuclease/exonuclease/phosphatase family protein [Nonomuraea phyllanthi]|nr:endonuclease/exonuclease/phosphatase [Nonomuraea phyllanthi]
MRDSVPALTRVIAAMRADVLCVQEAPRLRRSRRGALAAAAGLRVATPGRVGGVAVFTGPRVRVLHAESHALRLFLGLERRGLALAVVDVAGARLAVGSLHLDLHDSARVHHAAEAVALMERAAGRFGATIVLGGDINEQAHQPAWRLLAGRLADCHAVAARERQGDRAPQGERRGERERRGDGAEIAPERPADEGLTFTSARPAVRIDGVFAAREAHVVSCGGVDASSADLAGASDHLPVVAELRIGH